MPALVYVLSVAPGLAQPAAVRRGADLLFRLPVVGHMGYSAVVLHYGFELSNMGNAYLYGRAAHAADCATLKIPADERPLRPSPARSCLAGRGRPGQRRKPRRA